MNKKQMINEKIIQLQNIVDGLEFAKNYHLKNYFDTKEEKYIDYLNACIDNQLKLIKRYLVFIKVLSEN